MSIRIPDVLQIPLHNVITASVLLWEKETELKALMNKSYAGTMTIEELDAAIELREKETENMRMKLMAMVRHLRDALSNKKITLEVLSHLENYSTNSHVVKRAALEFEQRLKEMKK